MSHKPRWVDSLPRARGLLYGTGEGNSLQQAYAAAVNVIAGQLQVNIRSTLTQVTTQRVREVRAGGKRHERVQTHEYARDTSRMLVNRVMDDIRIKGQYNAANGRVHVLAALDLAALRRRKKVLVETAMAAMTGAAERLAAEYSGPQGIRQEAVLRLVGVLEDVRGLGRSRIGRSVRSKWRPEMRLLKRSLGRVLKCIELEKLDVGQGSNRMVSVRVTCRGRPWVNAHLRTLVRAGLANVPAVLTTNKKGELQFRRPLVYGNHSVKLGVVHDLRAVAGAALLSMNMPGHRGWIRLAADKQAVFSVRIAGGKAGERRRMTQVLHALLLRKWGARVVRERRPLTAVLSIRFGNPVRVYEETTQPVSVAVRVVGPAGRLFDRTVTTGGMGINTRRARSAALVNAIQGMSRW